MKVPAFNPTANPGSYQPGFLYAPLPVSPSLRQTRPINFLQVARKGRQTGDLLTEEAGAVIGGVVAALGQLDHFLRRAYDLGFFRHAIKSALAKLVKDSDRMLELYANQYDSATGDMANRMGEKLGQSAKLLLRLSPRQVHSSLLHMHTMVEQNMDYVPLPVASRGLLPTTDGWLLVALETPYAGDEQKNVRYARACLRDCLSRRETPLAGHLLLTQPGIVDPESEAEQQLATEASAVWTQYAQLTVVYTDLGTSPRMKNAIARANHEGRQVEYRTLPGWLEAEPGTEEGEAVGNTGLSATLTPAESGLEEGVTGGGESELVGLRTTI